MPDITSDFGLCPTPQKQILQQFSMPNITSEFLGQVQPHKTKILNKNTYYTTYFQYELHNLTIHNIL
uniref:Uncharacterized protein n=1 Tax=Arundo donax TaxID=35708 RepID=A0A0A8YD00_ARUDO